MSDKVLGDHNFMKVDERICSVCSSPKKSHYSYCDECLEHKRLADKIKKTEARNRAFGSIL